MDETDNKKINLEDSKKVNGGVNQDIDSKEDIHEATDEDLQNLKDAIDEFNKRIGH